MRIGIDLSGTKIEGIALDDSGRALLRRRVPTPQGDYRATVDAVAALLAAIEEETHDRGTVGAGIPGRPVARHRAGEERQLDVPDRQAAAA